ncbi:hypothetical protein Agabi119p4_5091 [Agaricus bisporus var. burnettii]|uniref:Uncharacterized protein n=1 Tax=Agaricus bisporus var. burnettii TaxID=192524 RepID=A0A8H7F4J5_AGABI|nr:hypothetical protein Agabi119p4_5091 [Agaricus bisporus var. burnettii]
MGTIVAITALSCIGLAKQLSQTVPDSITAPSESISLPILSEGLSVVSTPLVLAYCSLLYKCPFKGPSTSG